MKQMYEARNTSTKQTVKAIVFSELVFNGCSHNCFRYEFTAHPAGTHWYHSHTGLQRDEGLYGAVIVRLPTEMEVHRQQYDYDLSEHTMIITDWYPQPATNRFLEMNHRRNPALQPLLPFSGLINGKTKKYEV